MDQSTTAVEQTPKTEMSSWCSYEFVCHADVELAYQRIVATCLQAGIVPPERTVILGEFYAEA